MLSPTLWGIVTNDRVAVFDADTAETRAQLEAFTKAGIPRPRRDRDGVGAVHILRHSGAVERLKRTGNPKAVQDQLRHKSALMTLRYLKTISADESLKIQQAVDFQW